VKVQIVPRDVRAGLTRLALPVALILLVGCGVTEKRVYSDMGFIVANEVKLPLFEPIRSRSGYLFYVFPTKSAGHATKDELYRFRQIIALDTACSDGSVCEWDPDKVPDLKCTQISGVLKDKRVLLVVKSYLRERCK